MTELKREAKFAKTVALAKKGDEEAQCALGDIYEYGKMGVEKDYKQAVKWYKKAADQGNAYAEYRLFYMYNWVIDVEIDMKKSIKEEK